MSRTPPPPGTPRYRLDRRIATGGMGEVWSATDELLEREVAVKILKREYADDPTFRERFTTEARHAAALNHPNVASVLDFGELPPDDGSDTPRPFLVMELVPGQPLSALLRGEPMPPDRAADLVTQAAEAVAAAHAIGIVHRDIKPANLLVTPEGTVKITDFGIARAADAASLTLTGQIVGTPQYLSPEQASGKPATKASDVYALGIVLYEALAGRRPFDGDTPIATALKHLREDPPPLPESVPEHLRYVVRTALAKQPGDRFPSAAALADSLRRGSAADSTQVLESSSTGAPGPRSRRRPGWVPWLAAAVVVLVVVGAVAALAGGGDSGDTPTANRPSQTPARTRTAVPTVQVRRSDVVGKPVADAAQLLRDEGLDVAEQTVANSGAYVAGTVGDVSPVGTVRRGATVALAVWGPRPVTQPAPAPAQHPQEHGHRKPPKKPKGPGHPHDKGPKGPKGPKGGKGKGKR